MEYVVYSSQVVLIALTGYLFFTIARLSRNGSMAQSPTPVIGDALDNAGPIRSPALDAMPGHSRPLPRIESIAQLQMMTGGQVLELRLNGFHVQRLQKKEWLLLGIGFYFHGACQVIGDHFQCSEQDLDDMLVFLLRRNFGIPQDQAYELIHRVHMAPVEQYQRDAANAGQQAARHWLRERRVPREFSLYTNLTEWGMDV